MISEGITMIHTVISEGSCDTEEIQLCRHRNKLC